MRIDLGGLIFVSALLSQITALSLTSLPAIPRTTGTPGAAEVRSYQGAGGVALIGLLSAAVLMRGGNRGKREEPSSQDQ